MTIDLAAIRAKLASANGWGCEKECGRDDVEMLLAEVERLQGIPKPVLTTYDGVSALQKAGSLLLEKLALQKQVKALEAQIEILKRDAALGAAVRALPINWSIFRRKGRWYHWYVDEHGDRGRIQGWGRTLAAALEDAGLMPAKETDDGID